MTRQAPGGAGRRPDRPRRGAIVLAAAAWLGLWPGGAAAQDPDQLAEGEGRNLVAAICSGCHSLQLVTQQGMPRKKWDQLLDWMVEQQGMPQLDPSTEAAILDYLDAHYGVPDAPQDPTRAGGSGGGFGVSPYTRVQPLTPGQ
jgi:mono/diheme cytochrome c family protein